MRGVTSAQVLKICRRLENDYVQKFVDAGGSGLDAWANNANIGVETRFGDRVGAIWATHVRYRRRTGWFGLFGPLVDMRTLEEIEGELRAGDRRCTCEDAAGSATTQFRPCTGRRTPLALAACCPPRRICRRLSDARFHPESVSVRACRIR
jgi:hypothetical protein